MPALPQKMSSTLKLSEHTAISYTNPILTWYLSPSTAPVSSFNIMIYSKYRAGLETVAKILTNLNRGIQPMPLTHFYGGGVPHETVVQYQLAWVHLSTMPTCVFQFALGSRKRIVGR